jgi:acyl-coenzyme A synthetase/AMP-(fatty) acid ligase
LQTFRLASVKTMLSTGSPLAPESFDFVYREIKSGDRGAHRARVVAAIGRDHDPEAGNVVGIELCSN